VERGGGKNNELPYAKFTGQQIMYEGFVKAKCDIARDGGFADKS